MITSAISAAFNVLVLTAAAGTVFYWTSLLVARHVPETFGLVGGAAILLIMYVTAKDTRRNAGICP